jgi:hypothetical protein
MLNRSVATVKFMIWRSTRTPSRQPTAVAVFGSSIRRLARLAKGYQAPT